MLNKNKTGSAGASDAKNNRILKTTSFSRGLLLNDIIVWCLFIAENPITKHLKVPCHTVPNSLPTYQAPSEALSIGKSSTKFLQYCYKQRLKDQLEKFDKKSKTTLSTRELSNSTRSAGPCLLCIISVMSVFWVQLAKYQQQLQLGLSEACSWAASWQCRWYSTGTGTSWQAVRPAHRRENNHPRSSTPAEQGRTPCSVNSLRPSPLCDIDKPPSPHLQPKNTLFLQTQYRTG